MNRSQLREGGERGGARGGGKKLVNNNNKKKNRTLCNNVQYFDFFPSKIVFGHK